MVCKCDGGERARADRGAGRGGADQTATPVNTKHTHEHMSTHAQQVVIAATCARSRALKSHTNRQLPATRCEFVIMTHTGSISRERVVA